MVDEEWLKEVEERANKATEGPWIKAGVWIRYPSMQMFCVLDDDGFTGTEQAHYNTAFIAHSRTDVPRLLSTVRELQAQLNLKAEKEKV